MAPLPEPPPSTGHVATLRDHRFVVLLLLAGALGVPAALITVAFIKAFTELADLIWETIPDSLDVSTLPLFGLVVTTLAGLTVGLVVRYAPGHAGPDAAAGHGVGGDEDVRLSTLPGVAATSLVSLSGGASLGPEAPLVTLVGSLGRWAAQRLHLDEPVGHVLVLSMIASVIGGIFGSPLAAALLVLEILPVAAANRYIVLFPALVSSTISLFIFVWLVGDSFASYHLPPYEGYDAVDLVYAVLIGILGAAAGMGCVYGFRVVDRLLLGITGRHVLRGVLGGAALGLTAISFGELVLFSGEHQLQEVIDGDKTVAALLLLIAGKIVATAVCMATGFRGGRVFPALFVGGVLGVAFSDLFSSVPPALAIACGMTAAGIAVIRLPVFVVLMVGFFTAPELIPLLVISAVTSYVLVGDLPEFHDEPEPNAEPQPAPAA
jgi:H+/Cl- antiporter ClcA